MKDWVDYTLDEKREKAEASFVYFIRRNKGSKYERAKIKKDAKNLRANFKANL